MGSYLQLLDGAFDRIGTRVDDATQAGDLVLANDDSGVARHLYVLVEPDRRTFLTATHDHGVIAVRGFIIADVSGVYRMKEAAR